MPSTSIFADRSTKQTIIHTTRRGDTSFLPLIGSGGFLNVLVYIIPPFVDDNDKLFSFAQLLAAGYISLKSDGMRPDGNIDIGRHFQAGLSMLEAVYLFSQVTLFIVYFSNGSKHAEDQSLDWSIYW